MADTVFCDYCGKDWTFRQEPGGILFETGKVSCPDCAGEMVVGADRHREIRGKVRAVCPPSMSFARWVVWLRQGERPASPSGIFTLVTSTASAAWEYCLMPKIMGQEATLIAEEDWGDRVVCDFCGADWTGRPESGGLLFVSKAACPDCAPDIIKGAARYGELHHVRGHCPPSMSFARWVISLAGGEPRMVREYAILPKDAEDEKDPDT